MDYLHYSTFRFLFGLYLAVHFADIIPYGEELFAQNGMIPRPELLPTYTNFPNLLSLIDRDAYYIGLFLGAMAVVALLFSLGWFSRTCAFLLWYGWACLLNRNIFISNPGMPYVGWLLLVCAIIQPPADHERSKWRLPPILFWGAWFLMALGYTVSGIHKLQCSEWRDGTALNSVLTGPLARNNLIRDLLLRLPTFFLRITTWGSLLLEISFLPFGLFYHTRLPMTLCFLAMHLGILLVVNFTDLTVGVLFIHLFTLESQKMWALLASMNRWLQDRTHPGKDGEAPKTRGVCEVDIPKNCGEVLEVVE